MLRASNICLWLGAFVFESVVFCQTYVPINAFAGGPTLETFPTSINDQGVIAGYYTDALANAQHGFVRVAEGCGSVVPICTPFISFDAHAPGLFTTSTFASSINDAGAITGYFATLTNPGPLITNHGYVRHPGSLAWCIIPTALCNMPTDFGPRSLSKLPAL